MVKNLVFQGTIASRPYFNSILKDEYVFISVVASMCYRWKHLGVVKVNQGYNFRVYIKDSQCECDYD